MAISDVYTATTSVTSAAAGPTALLSLYGQTTKRVWIVGVRVECTTTGAAAGNSSLFVLARPNATNTGTTPTGVPGNDYSSPTSLGLISTAWSTTPTTGTVLADWTIPQTTGSAWEEFPPLGYEWGVPAIASANANAGVHLFVTQNATSSTYTVQFVWSE